MSAGTRATTPLSVARIRAWLVLVLGALLATRAGAEAAERPNILIILADDLGTEWIGAYGADGIRTPNIDRLAEAGMRFETAYSMPLCTPTRVTLLTGQYPSRHGWIHHWDVPRWGAGVHFDWRENPSFARVLREHGYATAAAGKWQINDFRIQPDALARHGFDDYCMWTGYETGNPASDRRYQAPYVHTRNGSRTRAGAFGPDVFVDFLIDFMERHRSRPMLLYYPMVLTHLPLTPTPLEPAVEGEQETFRAMVRYTDHAVGRLLAALDELELRRRTIVLFAADNGTSRRITNRQRGRDVRGGKGQLLESGIRVPFIVHCPGLVPEGRVTSALTDFTDIFPTVLELAGAAPPSRWSLDGHSLAPLLLGRTNDSPRDWILSMGGGRPQRTAEGIAPITPFAPRALRGKRYKLWVLPGGERRLFDLDTDPEEAHDLSASTAPAPARARERLEAVVRTLPSEDARPRYRPTPPQAWDLPPPE